MRDRIPVDVQEVLAYAVAGIRKANTDRLGTVFVAGLLVLQNAIRSDGDLDPIGKWRDLDAGDRSVGLRGGGGTVAGGELSVGGGEVGKRRAGR